MLTTRGSQDGSACNCCELETAHSEIVCLVHDVSQEHDRYEYMQRLTYGEL